MSNAGNRLKSSSLSLSSSLSNRQRGRERDRGREREGGGFHFTDEELLAWRSTALIAVEEEYSELQRIRKLARMNDNVDDLEETEG
jgi:hypothetical protein